MTYVFIQNKLTGHVIDIEANSTKKGALLDAYPKKSTNFDNQQWEFSLDSSSSGYYFIKSKLSGNVIDIVEASAQSGAPLDAFSQKAEDAGNQLWQFILDPGGSGYCFIRNKLTGHAIEIKDSSSASGAALVASELNLRGNGNQLWKPSSGNFPKVARINPTVTGISGSEQFDVAGSGFLPFDRLTLKYSLAEASFAVNSYTSTAIAAEDGTFLDRIMPPNYPGPEYRTGTNFGVEVTDHYGLYVEAAVLVDANGNFSNFRVTNQGVAP